jgi:hypothetical protein
LFSAGPLCNNLPQSVSNLLRARTGQSFPRALTLLESSQPGGKASLAKRRFFENKGRLMTIQRLLRNSIGAAVLATLLLTLAIAPATASAARIFVTIAPPIIPVYSQPLAPGYGYIWTPGYWAYDDGYTWVDGAWVEPPYVDALWTPGYWGWGGGGYLWYPGYWGRTVGYYGGINYGFGYFGVGFYGGYWGGGHFFYNSAYNHIGFGGGYVYNHPVAGFESGRPGGAAFARAGATQAYNRGAGVNGNSFPNHAAATTNVAHNSYAGGEARGAYSGSTSYARPAATASPSAGARPSYSGGASYGGGARVSGGGGGGGHAGGGGHR